ncbi:MAG TPA: hypothetical protein VFC67_19340 [Prolixibacteraceae bacterium]|nr:hypothetical protein [Prolixibacteraceae bacterium]
MKTTVKVDISVHKAEDLITTGEDVLKRHVELGEKSPLNGLVMETFAKNLNDAKARRAEAKKLHDQAELLNQQAGLSLGTDPTQNSKTTGTVYSTISSVRGILLGLYKGQEKKLSEWGFDVVISDVPQSTKTKA